MLDVLKLSWRNIWRSKRRSLLTIFAIAFSFVVLLFSMAFQRGSYNDMIQNTVRTHTGHLQVQREGYWPDQSLHRKLVRPDELLALLKETPGILGATPRIKAGTLVSKGNNSFGAMIWGIDPELESTVSVLPNLVREGRFLEADDLDGALIGAGLAANLDAAPGDEIVFMGQGADGSMAAGRLIVRGIVKTGFSELDRSILVMPIRAMDDTFAMYGSVSEIAILLDSDRLRLDTALALQHRLKAAGREDAAVLGWPELLPGVEESIRLDWNSGLFLYGFLVLVVGFGIANTFLMAFLERIYEFGVMLAIGMKPPRLWLLVYLESVLMILAGLVLGILTGTPLVRWFETKGIHFGESAEELFAEYGMSPIIYPLLSPLVYAWAFGIIAAIALIVAIYPAVKAARLNPVEALRAR